MFKYFLVLVVIVGTATCWEIPVEYKEIGDSLIDVCVAESGADKELILATRASNTFPEVGSKMEANAKCYLKCIFEKAGWFKDGKFDDESVRKSVPDRLKPVYTKVTAQCKGLEGDDDCESVWKIQTCFYQKVENKKHYFMI